MVREKWWARLAMGLMDMAITNFAALEYQTRIDENCSRREFMTRLIEDMLSVRTVRGQGRPAQPSNPIVGGLMTHNLTDLDIHGIFGATQHVPYAPPVPDKCKTYKRQCRHCLTIKKRKKNNPQEKMQITKKFKIK